MSCLMPKQSFLLFFFQKNYQLSQNQLVSLVIQIIVNFKFKFFCFIINYFSMSKAIVCCLIIILIWVTVSANSKAPSFQWEWPWDSSSSKSQFDSVKFQLLALKKSQYRRAHDGYNNNLRRPSLNSVNTTFRRLSSALYQDNIQIPNNNLPNPRDVSNIVGEQPQGPITPNRNHLTALFTFWGQFTDHDLTLGLPQNSASAEKMPIKIPNGDKFFTPGDNIPFNRTQYATSGLRAQKNSLTGWLDGSQIYGSDPAVAASLRTGKNGKLQTSGDNLLSREPNSQRFKAGDTRVNENLALTTIQTLLNRQHNRLCQEILALDGNLKDEQIFHIARNFLIGILQKITYEDWLPNLLGFQAWNYYIGSYTGYDQSRDARIPNQFSNAAFRIGHPLLISKYPQVNQYNKVVQVLQLKKMFERFDLMTNTRMNLMLRGLTAVSAKQKSRSIIDDIRNFLFLEQKVDVKLDLFALNLQRSRDHGLPSYNVLRQALGLRPYSQISDITSDNQTISRLISAYGTLDKIEPWVGIICQTPNFDGVLGQLGSTIVGITFRDIRAGDRFWYQNYMDQKLIRMIKKTTLGDIILRNTDIKDLYNENVFKLPRS